MKPRALPALVVLFAGAAGDLHADVGFGPHPQRPVPHFVHPRNAVRVVLEPTDAPETRLIIPRPLLSRAARVAHSDGSTGLRNGAAGLALAVTLGGAGLCLVRSRGRPLVRGALLLMALVTAVGAGGALLRADPAPPDPADAGLRPVGLLLDSVAVEVTETGDAIRLVVPRTELAGMARNLPPRQGK